MEKFTTFKGLAVALDRPNVDTDLIIPKQFLTRIERSGFGRFLFNDIRFNADGSEREDFILNMPQYKGSTVLVSRENFGCGSSREHAPWALMDYGFRVIISPSFADIFKNNSFKNGLLLIELAPEKVTALIDLIEKNPGFEIFIDLPLQSLSADGFTAEFDIDPFRKELLLKGWDDISLTAQKEDKIAAYEASHNKVWQAAISR